MLDSQNSRPSLVIIGILLALIVIVAEVVFLSKTDGMDILGFVAGCLTLNGVKHNG